MKRLLASALLLILILTSSVSVGVAFAQPAEMQQVIVGFKGLPDAALVHAFGGQINLEYSLIPAIACSLPAQAIDALKRNPNVAYVEGDFEAAALEYGVGVEDWGITKIGANTVHSTNLGAGIKVGIVDTGINKDHEDLIANYRGGWDFVNNDNDPMDDNGHGTHCAGIIAAAHNEIAVVGVAPEASLYAYKVLNSQGSGYISAIVAGINRAVTDGVQVISMSLGSTLYSQALYDACVAATSKNVVVIAAAGNSGNSATRSTVNYPAKFSCVIAVGATNANDALASFSSTGPEVDVAAPGVNILSDYKDVTPTDELNRDTAYMSGTSMACPHVAGAAALILSANPSLTPAQVQNVLQSTAKDCGATGIDNYYGYGRIDAAKAIVAATEVDTIPPAAVTGLTANAESSTQINLQWAANSEADLKGYNIYRGTSEAAMSKVAFVASPTSSYADAGLQASTTYYYKVAAVDQSQNEGSRSTVVSATTQPVQLMRTGIQMSTTTSGSYTFATAIVTVTDANGQPVQGAVVSGKWSGATKDSDTGTTNADGVTSLQSNSVRNARTGTTFTFTITSITKAGYVFDSASSETRDSIKKP